MIWQWICGTVPSLPGFVAYVNPAIQVPVGLTHLYYICFLSGAFISGTVYVFLHYVFPDRRLQEFVAVAPPARVLMEEYRERLDSVEVIRVGAPKLAGED